MKKSTVIRLALLGIGVAIWLDLFFLHGSLLIQVLGIIALAVFAGLALLPSNWYE